MSHYLSKSSHELSWTIFRSTLVVPYVQVAQPRTVSHCGLIYRLMITDWEPFEDTACASLICLSGRAALSRHLSGDFGMRCSSHRGEGLGPLSLNLGGMWLFDPWRVAATTLRDVQAGPEGTPASSSFAGAARGPEPSGRRLATPGPPCVKPCVGTPVQVLESLRHPRQQRERLLQGTPAPGVCIPPSC